MTRLTKEQNKAYEDYILSCIDGSNYDIHPTTNEAKLLFLYDTFKKEATQTDNITNDFKEWVMGLPTAFNVEFENYKIIELAVKMGSLAKEYSEKEADKIINGYFNFIAVKTIKLLRKHKVI